MTATELKPIEQAEENVPTAVARADVFEREDEYVVEADLPGVAAADVDIRFEDGELAIVGRRKNRGYHRTFRLGEGVASDRIEAAMTHGVLTLRTGLRFVGISRFNLDSKSQRRYPAATLTAVGVCVGRIGLIVLALLALPAAAAETPVGKTIADVVPVGLRLRPKDHVLAKILSKPGKAYEDATIQEDVRRLIGTGWFEQGGVRVETAIGNDNRVMVYFVVRELNTIVTDVKFVGAQHMSDDELLRLADVRKGSAADPTGNEAAAQRIQNKYRDDGRYFATVSVSEGKKPTDTRVVFSIVEGPKVKVRHVSFKGNVQVPSDRMAAKLTIAGPLWGTLRILNNKFQPMQFAADKEKLLDYLHQLGHLEARVQEEIIPSSDLASVDIVIHINEGPIYTVGKTRLEQNKLFDTPRLEKLVELKASERYDRLKCAGDEKRIETFYGFRGYDVRVKHQHYVVPDKPGVVDVVYTVFEPAPRTPASEGRVINIKGTGEPGAPATGASGTPKPQGLTPPARQESLPAPIPVTTGGLEIRGQAPSDLPPRSGDASPLREPDRVGNIRIFGNTVTHQDVILNELRNAGVLPGQVLQYPMLEVAKNNLIRRGIFDMDEGKQPRVEVMPNNFDTTYKDIAVYVTETRTGQFMVGAAVNSNVGLNGSVVINERNFDILRVPTSLDDFLNGRAFRGAGQELRIEAMPGTTFQRYAITWRDPYFLNSDFGITNSAYFNERSFAEYTENRYGGRFTLDRRLDPIWRASGSLRVEGVDLSDIPSWAPPSISDYAGTSFLLGLRGGVSRDTRDSYLFPSSGSLIDINYEQVLGTYTYPIGSIEGTKFFTTEWLQRNDGAGKHILSLRSQVSVTSQNAPVYERFYAGGIRSFRGFTFRGMGPVENQLETGGSFLWLNTVEYQVPLNAKESVFFATFCDHGTNESDVRIGTYRVSVGFGFRVQVPAMGPVPLAFDFAFPLNKAPEDRRQVFAFYVGLFGGQ